MTAIRCPSNSAVILVTCVWPALVEFVRGSLKGCVHNYAVYGRVCQVSSYMVFMGYGGAACTVIATAP